jgi:4-hydroxybenzoate polyprenyltransferase
METNTNPNILIKILDHFFVLRPTLHLPVWTILLLGYASQISIGHHSPELLLALICATGLFGGVFLINQIYDIESDRLNDKVYFLPRGIISLKTAWIMTLTINIVSLVIAFIISISVGIISILLVILGIFYSAPPFAFKGKPWAGALANGLGHGTFVYMLGYSAAGGGLLLGGLRSLPYFLAVASVYIGTTLPDMDGDKNTDKITLSVKFGVKKTILFMFISYLLALVAALLVGDIIFWIAAGIVAPLYFYAFAMRTTKAAFLAVKISVASLSLAAAYLYPLYLVFLALFIFATRVYYKKRFGLVYPSLG